MGMTGIDWRLYCKWARSQTSSMTLIHDGKFQTATFTTTWKLQVYLQLLT
jgi:hypothetical protein